MNIPAEVKTAAGHTLGLKEINPGDMLDLIEAAGSAMSSASAGAWLGYAQMICSVTSIDGVPVQMPITKDEVRNLATEIGNDGVAALSPIFYPKADAKTSDATETAKN